MSLQRPKITTMKINVHERINLMRQTVKMVAEAVTPAAIITGPGGLGKTHEVTAALAEIGFHKHEDYHVVKGYSSPRGLYEALYRNNGTLTVFDDCDSTFSDRTAVEILKGALDSYSIRTISWLVKAQKLNPATPDTFEFDGRVIFVSNMQLEQLSAPLRARCLVIDIQMTRDEIIARIREILPAIKGFTAKEKALAFAFVVEWANRIRNLNLRTIQMVLKIIRAHPKDWHKLAIYTVTL
jgi:hypothetical protein